MAPSHRLLFQIEGSNLDKAYINLRDRVSDTASEYRDFFDSMWVLFEPFADSQFEIELSQSTQARLWEMYLACSILEMGHQIESSDSGPDISFMCEGRRHWVEAICPGAGHPDNPDIIPETIAISEGGGAYDVPVRQIILRLTSAIKDKARIFSRYLKQGIVKEADVCIIAISGSKMLNGIPSGGVLPYICHSVFPIGDMYITFNKENLKQTGSGFHHRPTIPKTSGVEIPTTIFFDKQYNHISGVMFAANPPYNFNPLLGADLITVHNPNATNPFSMKLFPRGAEYWVEGDQLHQQALS